MSLSPRTKTRLRRLAAKYETAAFVDGDPIHFLRTASGPGVETMAFVSATRTFPRHARSACAPGNCDGGFAAEAESTAFRHAQAPRPHRRGTRRGRLPTFELEITARLSEAFPGDPCRGDFALYGLGIDEDGDGHGESMPKTSSAARTALRQHSGHSQRTRPVSRRFRTS